MIEIAITLTLININVLAWVVLFKCPLTASKRPTIDEKEKDKETIEKEKLAKEWANMMNYNGTLQGGDER